QRRPDRRLQRHHPPRQGPGVRPEGGREAEGAHSTAAVSGRDPGSHRQQDYRPRDHFGVPEGRARQVLRRRHNAQAQAPREAEGGEEAHEADRRRRDPAGGVPGGPAGGIVDGSSDRPTVLVIQTAFLGDVVLTTPLLAALAERHGPVDVVTTPAAAPLLASHPAVRQVIPYDNRGRDRGLAGMRRLAQRLATEQYETAYLPHR